MSEKIYSPVLDYKMIIENLSIFNSISGFYEEYNKLKSKTRGKCEECKFSERNSFAQFIRNKIIEENMKHIFSNLNPRTIIRYGGKIYRASDFI